MDKKKLFAEIDKIEERVIEIRRQIHRQPELEYQEEKTAALAAKELKKLDIAVETGVYHTGVCGLLENSRDKEDKTILLRADMDALPIQENTGAPYSSEVPGVMHACGHDGHTAILIGAAMVLNELQDEFEGNVKFIFQPAEETTGGAKGMIEEGVLENPKVDAALALHLWGTLPRGMIEYKSGPVMASPDAFNIKIIGSGGHAAQPHNCVDPVPIAATIIDQFQNIVSRRIDPLESAVISVCHLAGGETHNVIPDEVFLEGTVRSLTPEIRKEIPRHMEEVVDKITSQYGADYIFDYDFRYPPLHNDSVMTKLVKKSAEKVLGQDRVREADKPNMGGEDFSYLAREVPSSFFFLGIAPSEEETIPHHQPEFDVDDRVLRDGIAVMCQAVIDYLS